MDNPKAEVRNHPKFSKGVFAKELIRTGEEIAAFDGEEYIGYYNSEMPPEVVDHGMQIAHDRVRNSKGFARLINHSCAPNCGVKDLIHIVAMRDIQVGEEILWDYDMSDNAEWEMYCMCDASDCRKVLRGYRFLPQRFRDRYEGYISEYLLEEEIPVLPLPEGALDQHPALNQVD